MQFLAYNPPALVNVIAAEELSPEQLAELDETIYELKMHEARELCPA